MASPFWYVARTGAWSFGCSRTASSGAPTYDTPIGSRVSAVSTTAGSSLPQARSAKARRSAARCIIARR
jgi:hypothetical protein